MTAKLITDDVLAAKADAISEAYTMHTVDDVKTAIDSWLDCYFTMQARRAAELDPQFGVLWESTRRIALAGGKRLRPYLLVLAYEAYGGSDYRNIIEVGLAHELLHLFLLVHDDVFDRDYVRHGIQNIAGQYRSRYKAAGQPLALSEHYADAAAITAGDLLASAAYEQLFANGLSDTDKLAAMRIMSRMIFEVGGGQLLDMEAVMSPLPQADPMKIARYKTSGYTFVGPLLTGATLAHADDAQLRLLEAFGYDIGIAFQITDDILGAFGDEIKTGKSNSSDLREGKRTLLALECYRQVSGDQRRRFMALYGKADMSNNEADEIRRLMTETGAKALAEKAATDYSGRARSTLENLAIDEDARQALLGLVEKVTKRVN